MTHSCGAVTRSRPSNGSVWPLRANASSRKRRLRLTNNSVAPESLTCIYGCPAIMAQHHHLGGISESPRSCRQRKLNLLWTSQNWRNPTDCLSRQAVPFPPAPSLSASRRSCPTLLYGQHKYYVEPRPQSRQSTPVPAFRSAEAQCLDPRLLTALPTRKLQPQGLSATGVGGDVPRSIRLHHTWRSAGLTTSAGSEGRSLFEVGATGECDRLAGPVIRKLRAAASSIAAPHSCVRQFPPSQRWAGRGSSVAEAFAVQDLLSVLLDSCRAGLDLLST